MPLLLNEAPRVVVEGRGIVWVDCRGLPAEQTAGRILARCREKGWADVRAGLAFSPVVAEAAAHFGEGPIETVGRSEGAAFLAPLPLTFLTEDERVRVLLEGSGLHRCGELAELTAESVEVRFGPEGRRIWHLARGEDPRILFRPIPPERPHAAVDFVDYTVRDATRLVFTLNALLDQVCGTLVERAQRASAIELTFTLAGGGTAIEVLRTARPTAERALWLRRLRTTLERVQLPDAISGVALEVVTTTSVSAVQGDLFDTGFATASAVEESIVRLLDSHPGLFVRQANMPHALAERRVEWIERTPEEIARTHERIHSPGLPPGRKGSGAKLELQLLERPKLVQVRTRARRDHLIPTHYREDDGWHTLTPAGPDRISGGHEESRTYAREYFRCVSDDGTLLWLYRDAVEDRWYLHGWWD